MAPRSFVFHYRDAEAARRRDAAGRFLSLNGDWRFSWGACPDEAAPADFFSEDFDDSSWQTIAVPSEWEFAGWGRPHYSDVLAVFPLAERPFPPQQNPTGCYRRHFTLPDDELLTTLRFEGVESGFHLWVNGTPAGYSQGSRLVSEFDISGLVRPGDNVLAVRVYKFTDGAFLEKQDMWYLAGIMRDVSLIRYPRLHIADVRVLTRLALRDAVSSVRGGHYDLDVEVAGGAGGGRLREALFDGEACLYGSESPLLPTRRGGLDIAGVRLWSAENPALYDLVISIEENGVEDHVALRVGFRSVEVSGGLLRVNGAPLKLRGVNYHLWQDTAGRRMDGARLRADLEMLKKHNVNAVRTSHYPQPALFYDLCDEMGFYVMSEADLECCSSQLFGEPNLLADSPLWKEAFLDRVRRTVTQELNHPSVILWSLGNESGYGRNFQAASELAHELDSSRPVHYEEDREARSADVFSSMYTHHAKLRELGAQNLPKPHIVCEYGHAMGNGPGGLEDYGEIFEAYPRLQGGFIWEWRDHTIRRVRPDGKEEQCYGGDFGDRPTDGPFCADGLTLGDGRPTPALAQVKHLYAPLRALSLDSGRVKIWNRADFRDASCYEMRWTREREGEVIATGRLVLPAIPPGEAAWVELPGSSRAQEALEDVLTLRFFPRDTRPEEEERAEIDVCQFLPPEKETPAAARETGGVRLEQEGSELSLRGDNGVSLDFSLSRGGVSRWGFKGADGVERPLLEDGFEMCFYRAPIANDRNLAPLWDKAMLPYLQPCVLCLEAEDTEWGVEVRVKKRYAPFTMDWFVEADLRYCFFGGGGWTLAVEGDFHGKPPAVIPRIGLYGRLSCGLENVRWYGRGPGECYRDSKAGSPVGVYAAAVDGLHFPYAVPQENGNRTDVRRVSFQAENGAGLCVEAVKPGFFNFSAHHYSLDDLVSARHDAELPRRPEIYVHFDHAHHGLGSASCGPEALQKDSLAPGPFAFALRFTPLTL